MIMTELSKSPLNNAIVRQRRRRATRGATMIQYVILLGCIAVPALAAYVIAGPKLAENAVRIAISVMGLEEGK